MIRHYIRELEDERLMARYHGGVSIPSTVENIDYDQRRVMDSDAKRRIGQLAAAQVENDRSLIINIGTTTEGVSKALLRHCGLRVVTSNLNVASILSNCDDAEVIVAGGVVRKRDRGITGEATIDFMRQFKVDIGIIGVSGIEADGTMLDHDYREVRVTQTIMEQSRQVWLVPDHTKFGRHPLVRLGNIPQVDKFFTDCRCRRRPRRLLRRPGWRWWWLGGSCRVMPLGQLISHLAASAKYRLLAHKYN